MLKRDLERLSSPGIGGHERIKVLDIGSSDGRMWLNGPLSEIRHRLDVTLIDPVFSDTPTKGIQLEGLGLRTRAGFAPKDLILLEDAEFDVVIAFDLIEHLSQSDGYLLLYEMDRIASRMSVVYTPTGFLWQPPSKNNPFNAHISGWHPQQLAKLGWNRITGIFGFGFLMGPYAVPKISVKGRVTSFLMSISQILARPFPSLAHSFYALKLQKSTRIPYQDIQLP